MPRLDYKAADPVACNIVEETLQHLAADEAVPEMECDDVVRSEDPAAGLSFRDLVDRLTAMHEALERRCSEHGPMTALREEVTRSRAAESRHPMKQRFDSASSSRSPRTSYSLQGGERTAIVRLSSSAGHVESSSTAVMSRAATFADEFLVHTKHSDVDDAAADDDDDDSTDFPGASLKNRKPEKRWKLLVNRALAAREFFLVRPCWADEDRESMKKSCNLAVELAATDEQLFKHIKRAWVRLSMAGKRSTLMGLFGQPGKRGFGGSKLSKGRSTDNMHSGQMDSASYLVVHPYAWSRLFWTFLSILFVGFDIVLSTLGTYGLEASDLTKNIGFAACIFWTLDIGLSFFTGTFIKNQLFLDMKAIAVNYASTWFLFDVAMALVQWMVWSAETSEAGSGSGLDEKSAGVLRYLKIAKYVRLLRIAKVEAFVQQALARLNSLTLALVLNIASYLAALILYVHITGAMWYTIGKADPEGWSRDLSADADKLPLNYLLSVNWAAAQLQGNVDIYPGMCATERAFAVCHILASVVALAMLVSKLTTAMQAMADLKAKKTQMLDGARRYMEEHKISVVLSMRIRKYLEWKQVMDAKSTHSRDEQALLQLLPTPYRRALLDEARSPTLLVHPVFLALRDLNLRFFQRLCCECLVSVTVIAEEHIFSFGTVCERMYFALDGHLNYLKYSGVLQAVLSMGAQVNLQGRSEFREMMRNRAIPIDKGRWLAEPVLWLNWMHRGDLDADCQANLLVLHCDTFEDLLMSYPAVQLMLLRHAQRFAFVLQQAERDIVSDTVDTAQMFIIEESLSAESREAEDGPRSSFEGTLFHADSGMNHLESKDFCSSMSAG